LRDFTERMQINGVPIPQEELAALVEEIKPAVAQIPYLTTFELSTASPFSIFHAKRWLLPFLKSVGWTIGCDQHSHAAGLGDYLNFAGTYRRAGGYPPEIAGKSRNRERRGILLSLSPQKVAGGARFDLVAGRVQFSRSPSLDAICSTKGDEQICRLGQTHWPCGNPKTPKPGDWASPFVGGPIHGRGNGKGNRGYCRG